MSTVSLRSHSVLDELDAGEPDNWKRCRVDEAECLRHGSQRSPSRNSELCMTVGNHPEHEITNFVCRCIRSDLHDLSRAVEAEHQWKLDGKPGLDAATPDLNVELVDARRCHADF